MLLDEFVDAASVGFHGRARFFVKETGVTFGSGAKTERAEVLVDRNGARAENFGKLAARRAPQKVHLPQTILGQDVPLGFSHVGERSSADMRDAPDVAVYSHLILQAGERCCTVHLRERAKEKPPSEGAADEYQKCQKPA